jgi:hypothetical protein
MTKRRCFVPNGFNLIKTNQEKILYETHANIVALSVFFTSDQYYVGEAASLIIIREWTLSMALTFPAERCRRGTIQNG